VQFRSGSTIARDPTHTPQANTHTVCVWHTRTHAPRTVCVNGSPPRTPLPHNRNPAYLRICVWHRVICCLCSCEGSLSSYPAEHPEWWVKNKCFVFSLLLIGTDLCHFGREQCFFDFRRRMCRRAQRSVALPKQLFPYLYLYGLLPLIRFLLYGIRPGSFYKFISVKAAISCISYQCISTKTVISLPMDYS
jgi:hypothetical protein